MAENKKFDPDAFVAKVQYALAQPQEKKFDPDAFASKVQGTKPAQKELPKVGAAEAFVRGAAQGATFGFHDELSGGIAGAGAFLSGGDVKGAYKTERDRVRAANQAAEAQNPGAYNVGSLGSVLIPGGALIKGAKSVGAKVAQAGLIGATQGVGTSERETVKDIATEGVVGGTIGAVTQGVASKLANTVSSLAPEALKKKASAWATKAIGNETDKTQKIIDKKGGAEAFGSELRSLGIVGGAPKTKEEMLSLSKKIVDEEGSKIGQIYEQLDKSASTRRLAKVSAQEVIDKVKKEVLQPLDKVSSTQSLAMRVRSQFLDNFENSLAGTNVGFKRMHEELKGLGELAFEVKATDKRLSKELSKAYGILAKQIQADGKRVTEKTAPGLVDELLASNKKYSIATSAKDVIEDKIRRDSKNRGVSLTDSITGSNLVSGGLAAFGGSIEGMLKSLAMGGVAAKANQMGRTRGPQVLSETYEAAAALMERDPGFVQKFSGPLNSAANSGLASLAITHQTLLKDPEYFEAVEAEKRRLEQFRNRALQNQPKEGI